MLGRTYNAQDYMPIRFIGERGKERAAQLAERKRAAAAQRREVPAPAVLPLSTLPKPQPPLREAIAPVGAPPLARRMKRA